MVSAANLTPVVRSLSPVIPTNVTQSLPTAGSDDVESRELRWGALMLTLIIIASILGNVLVCLAVCWEKRLQNMTNFFLMSLAIADLLVSVLVMPFAMIVELYGEYIVSSLLICFQLQMSLHVMVSKYFVCFR